MKLFKVILLGLFLSTAAQTFAQSETFDMMTFTPPNGWERKEFKDRVSFLSKDRSCSIVVYESRESSGSGETDFKNEWQERVVKQFSNQFNAIAAPNTQDVTAKDASGQVLLGGAVAKNGLDDTKAAFFLLVYRDYGRAMSILSVLLDKNCNDDFFPFFKSVSFKPRNAR